MAVTVSWTFLVFDDLGSFEKYWSGFCRKFLNWNLSDIFLMYVLRRKNHRGKVPFSPYHVKDIYYPHDLSLLMSTLITWLRWCLSDFSAIKLLFFFPLSTLDSLERGHYSNPCLRNGELCMLHLLEVEYLPQIIWHSFTWEICLLCLFLYLINFTLYLFIL